MKNLGYFVKIKKTGLQGIVLKVFNSNEILVRLDNGIIDKNEILYNYQRFYGDIFKSSELFSISEQKYYEQEDIRFREAYKNTLSL